MFVVEHSLVWDQHIAFKFIRPMKILLMLLGSALMLTIVLLPASLITLIWCDKSYDDAVWKFILTDIILIVVFGMMVGFIDDVTTEGN